MNGIQRIEKSFSASRGFVGYLTAGDGGIRRTLDAALALIHGGINVLEIGVPFSDPIADGPVIQRAASRALAAGTTLQDILWLAENIRKHSNIPLILFSYLNPIFSAIRNHFLRDAQSVGIDGILIVDCPIEEFSCYYSACLNHELAPILIIAPSTPLARICEIGKNGHGFLYYACRKGTTGIRSALPEGFEQKIQTIKSHIDLPVVSGFGISHLNDANKILQYADGVVIGSLFVKALENNIKMDELTQLVQSVNPLLSK